MTLVGERGVLLVLSVRPLNLVPVRGQVRVVGRLDVVVLVVVSNAASRAGRVLVRTGCSGLLASVVGHAHQTWHRNNYQMELHHHHLSWLKHVLAF